MKKILLMTALLNVAASGAYAQVRADTDAPPNPASVRGPNANATEPVTEPQDRGHENFSDADNDGNGVLSVSEIAAALPQLAIDDSNADGVVSQAEAESALPELKFQERGRAGGDAPVAETEFNMIVMAINERDEEETAIGDIRPGE